MSSFPKITIEDYVSTGPVTVGPNTRIDEVLALIRQHRFRHLPVVEGRKIVGIISDRDVLLARPQGVKDLITAKEVMSRDPYTVRFDALLEDVAFQLSQRKFGSALVVDKQGELYGIFTSTDALNALVEILRGQTQL